MSGRVVRGWVEQSSVDLVRDVSFEAAHDVPGGESLGAAPLEVGHCAWFAVSHAQQHDPVQGRVRVPVPAAGEPMPCALARGGGDRRDTGEGGERCSGAEAFGVVASGDQQGCGGDRADPAQ